MIDTLAPSMFAKITLNKNAILVAYTLMSDVACASSTLKHSCAADFYVMLCGMRTLAVIKHFSLLLQSEVFTCYCSVSCPCFLLFVLLNSNVFFISKLNILQWSWSVNVNKREKVAEAVGQWRWGVLFIWDWMIFLLFFRLQVNSWSD